MKAMDFLTLLGELNASEGLADAPHRPRRKRRAPWIVAAACACLLLTVLSVWFFTPPFIDPQMNGGLQYTCVRIDNRLMSYQFLYPSLLSPYQALTLPDERGEVLATHGDCTFYRVADRHDLIYLIMVNGKGEQQVLEFAEPQYWPGIDMRDTQWYDSGWLTDEDIAAIENRSAPTMGEVLETIYGATSSEDIRRVRFEKDDAYNGKITKRVRVSSVTVRKAEDLERLWELIQGMEPADLYQKLPHGDVGVHDEAYLREEAPLSAQVNRNIRVVLQNGYALDFTFYPATGLLQHTKSDLYVVLPSADTEWLIDLAKIDMEWKDWGTESPPVSGDGNETASRPVSDPSDTSTQDAP